MCPLNRSLNAIRFSLVDILKCRAMLEARTAKIYLVFRFVFIERLENRIAGHQKLSLNNKKRRNFLISAENS